MNEESDLRRDSLSVIIPYLVILVVGAVLIFYSLTYLESTARTIVGTAGSSIFATGIALLLIQIVPLLMRSRRIGTLYRMSSSRDFVTRSYKNEILKCKKEDRVKIMGISLQSVISVPNIEKTLVEKIKEGVHFKILIMNPNSKYLEFRYKEYPFRTHLNAEIDQFTNFYNKLCLGLKPTEKERIELRYHEFAPRFFLLATRTRIFFQFYIYGFGEFNGPCFAFSRNSDSVSKMIEESFDHLWDLAQKVKPKS